ncbi:MAG TPA: ABC transporter permease [Blastocatellia bacterium]|nr:ABC transporter permease [Blastocatellia bacterium]
MNQQQSSLTKILLKPFAAIAARIGSRREIERELRSHIEMRIDENIESGMTPSEAREEAYQRFGNFLQVQHACAELKELKQESIMNAFFNDLRYGFRMLWKRPGFTIVAVVTLALGIGINSSIFSIINAVLLNPLPFKEPNRIVQFWDTNRQQGWNDDTMVCAPANFLDWQKRSQSFQVMAAYFGWTNRVPNLNDFLLAGDTPVRLRGLYVTGDFFNVLGVPPEIGRTFRPEETWEGNDHVVVLSHDLWQRNFGSDPSIVGKNITLNGVSTTVIGVMPAWFYFETRKTDMWAPFGWGQKDITEGTFRSGHWIRVIARLKPGVTLEQARQEMNGIAAQLEREYPEANKNQGVGLNTMQDWEVSDTKLALYVFLGAVAFVLLIACANVANLLLARSAARTKEFALRSALGAGRERIVRQLLTESLLLSVLGGTAGLFLATLCNRLVIAFSPGGIPRLEETRLDFRVVGFTLLVTLLTSIIFGLVPAISSSKTDLNDALKEAGQKGSTGKGSRLRNVLVIAEIALALVLVIGAGLMIKSFVRLLQVDPGFDPSHLLTVAITLEGDRYDDRNQVFTFRQQVLDRVKSLPGVQSDAFVHIPPPLGPFFGSDLTIQGHNSGEYGKGIRHNLVSPTYFETMKIPIIAGRSFTEADTPTTPRVTIISEELARRFFPNGDPIGKQVKYERPEAEGRWYTVVGIVKDVKQEGLSVGPKPQSYESALQRADGYMYLVVRTAGDPHNLVSAIVGEIKAVDKDQPPYNIRTMDELLSNSVNKERFTMLLLAVFAGVALLLASIGIYGVMSYTISQRSGEIGIRMALGAQRRDVMAMILRQGFGLVAMGLAIGLVGSLALTKLMTALLYDVSATDPAVFVFISVLLISVAMLACFVPARRATRIDPINALRYE